MTCATTVGEALKSIELGSAKSFKNVAVCPLTVKAAQQEADYLLLDEALEQDLLKIEEISEAGSVPELKVINSADRPVMILDGEELLGAKQNRVLNLTVLVPGRSTIPVPVSCVEAGRWSFSSRSFSSSKQTQYARGRASRAAQVSHSFVTSGSRTSNQRQIWADISGKSTRLGSRSPSSAMSDIYAAHVDRMDEYVHALSGVDGQGALFAIDGRVHGLDLFDSARTFRTVLPKLLRAYALDAIDSSARAERSSHPAACFTCTRFASSRPER